MIKLKILSFQEMLNAYCQPLLKLISIQEKQKLRDDKILLYLL